MTDAEKLQHIREWFGRHQNDYCVHDPQAPPQVWSEYFAWLLHRAIARGRTTTTERMSHDDPR